MTLIDQENLLVYLSGGEAVPDAYSSVGGGRGGAQMGEDIGSLFPAVSPAQAAAGLVQHRCIYLRNEDPNVVGLFDARAWISVLTPSPYTEVDIGLAPEGLNGIAELLEGGETAPAGVAFSRPTSREEGLVLPTPLLEGDELAVWMRRTIDAGAVMEEIDYCLLAFVGFTSEPA